MSSIPSIGTAGQLAPCPQSPLFIGADIPGLVWRDEALEEEADPKTAGFDRSAGARTTDLLRFDLEAAAAPHGDPSFRDESTFLSHLHGGNTIDIELTEPRARTAEVQALCLPDPEFDPKSPAPPASDQPSAPPAAAREIATREITTGTVLRSRYVLGKVLGRGGNCIVYQAQDLHRLSTDEREGSQIAVKVLLPELRTNGHALTRMKREFRQMQCLTHPGIARVFDLDCEGEDWFMTMELVEGQTVNVWMRDNASGREALRVINACCDALAQAHDLKILHGDLKPSNVLVAAGGSIKIIDFGSAPSPGAHAAEGSDLSLAATPSYGSPQVLAGNTAEPRDDVFSLACLSYAILSRGLHPFSRKSSLDAFNAQMRPAYVPGIPPRLFDVIVRGLAWEREQRPASVREFMHALISSDLSRSSALARDPVIVEPASEQTAEPTAEPSSAPRLPEPEPKVLIANSLQDVEQLLSVDTEAAGLLSLPALDTDFIANGRSDALAAETKRSLIVLGIVFAGTLSFILQALNESPPKPVAPLHTAPAAAPAIVAAAAPVTVSELVPEAAPPAVAEVPREPVNAPGVITFDSPMIEAGSAQTLVAITLKRLQSTRGAAKVAWRIDQGTARPGVDYEQMEPQVIRFVEGQPARSIFIPLLNSGDARGPRTFTVSLQKVAGGPLLGSISKVSVTIPPPHDRAAASSRAQSLASE